MFLKITGVKASILRGFFEQVPRIIRPLLYLSLEAKIIALNKSGITRGLKIAGLPSTSIFTSEQVGGEHHVLELRKIEAIEQAVVQVVHVRERAVVQPRPEVQVRQVAGVAQAVIQALILAEQLADLAPNLGHTTAGCLVVARRALVELVPSRRHFETAGIRLTPDDRS